VAGELAASSSGSDLDQRFRLLEGTSAVDLELEQMRRQLPGAKPAAAEPIAQLPPPQLSAADIEYERLRREIKG